MSSVPIYPDPTVDVPQGLDRAREDLRLFEQRREIDRSCRAPVLLLFASSVLWLLVGTVLAMLASVKLHSPTHATGVAWMTFGRVRPAHLTVVSYGWSAMAGLGVMLWLMCRLCRVPLQRPGILVLATIIWNIGVLLGAVAILAGHGNSVEWLEYPQFVSFPLFIAFALFGIWTILTFARRREGHVYVSQWYLFAAVFWFPWIYATAQILILSPAAVKGVAQESIHWWFGHNVLGTFFTPIGLAAIYYLIPKVIGRPVYSYHLSIIGFWSLALFYNWAGAHHLVGGPVPAWLVTVSAVSSMMMFIPVGTTALNHHMTMKGHFGALRYSPTLRFIVFGAMAYTVVSFQGSLLSVRIFNEPTHFTHHTVAHAHLGMYGFYTMVLFGSMYYIVPRLTGREWASARLIRVHFWTSAIGILLMFLLLTVGGLIQGLEMNMASASYNKLLADHGLWEGTRLFFAGMQPKSATVPFDTIIQDTIPWLWARSASGVLMTVGHVVFGILLWRNVLGRKATRVGPVLLGAVAGGSAREQP